MSVFFAAPTALDAVTKSSYTLEKLSKLPAEYKEKVGEKNEKVSK